MEWVGFYLLYEKKAVELIKVTATTCKIVLFTEGEFERKEHHRHNV